VPLAEAEQVLRLYRERYFDLNVRHFHEKLRAEHGIELSYTWVKSALQGAGLVARARQRGVHRRRRERRPLPGILLHIDGSRHHLGHAAHPAAPVAHHAVSDRADDKAQTQFPGSRREGLKRLAESGEAI